MAVESGLSVREAGAWCKDGDPYILNLYVDGLEARERSVSGTCNDNGMYQGRHRNMYDDDQWCSRVRYNDDGEYRWTDCNHTDSYLEYSFIDANHFSPFRLCQRSIWTGAQDCTDWYHNNNF